MDLHLLLVRNRGFLAGLSVAVALFLLPWLGVSNLTLQVVGFVLINIVAIQGLTVLYGYAHQVSLATGAFFGFGAYAVGISNTLLGLSPWVGLAIGALGSWALGAVVGLPALRLKGHYLAMGTIAFSALMVLLFTEAASITGGVDGMGRIEFGALPVIGQSWGRIITSYLSIVVFAALAVLLTSNIVRRTPGASMRAMADSEDGARSVGVEVEQITVRSFMFAGMAAGFAGGLYAMLVGFISPSLLAVHASIAFVAMAVIGGRNSLVGPIVATVLLTLIQHVNVLIPGAGAVFGDLVKSVQVEVYALLIIVLTIFAPNGLASFGRMFRRKRGGA